MERVPAESLMEQVRSLLGVRGFERRADVDLLRSFVERRDETAFALLVRRHGNRVLSVCRHVLRQDADAEDAFQATFMILARKAASIRKRTSLSSWLHGVAVRCAKKLRKSAMRRVKIENGATAERAASESPLSQAAFRELQSVLDEEIARLPAMYRAPFLLVCFEGKSRTEVAQALGCKEGTVASRVATARERLQKRLSARGIALSAALAAAVVPRTALSAGISAALASRTVDAALAFVTRKAAGVASAQGLALAQGVLKGMRMTKVKIALFAMIAASLALVAVGGLTAPPSADDAPKTAGPVTPPRQRIGSDARPSNEKRHHEDEFGDPMPAGASLRLGTVAFRHRNTMGSGPSTWGSGLQSVPSLFAYAPNGKTIAAPDGDHIKVWDLATQKVARTIALPASVPTAPDSPWWFQRAVHSPDGTLLLASAGKKTDEYPRIRVDRIFVFEAASGRLQRTLDRRDVQDFCFCGDNRTLAIVESNDPKSSQITLLDITTGKKLNESATIKTEERAPFSTAWLDSVAFLPRSKQLVTGENLCHVRIWNLPGLQMEVLPKKTLTSPRGVTVSGDGRFFLVLEDQFEVRSAETREIVKSLDYHDWPASEAFSPDGSLLAVGHHKGEVAVWETATWKRRYTFPTGRGPIVRFSPDSKTLASIDSAFRFWDMQTGKRMDRTFGHEEAIAELAFSPGGERLASIGFDRTLRIWDPKTGKQVRVQDVTCPPQFYTAEPNKEVAATRYPKSFAWSPDGAAMAVGMQLHDAKDGRLIRRFLDEKSTGYADFAPVNVALSFDGKFTNVNQQEIRRWETSSGKLLDRTAPQDGFLFEGKAVAAPDGSRTVSMGFDRSAKAAIVVSDLAANRQAIALQIPEFSRGGFMTPDVYDLAASPDSKRAAFGLFSIHVFDLADPGRSQTFGESTHAIGSLAFAPHGNALAAGRDDGTVEFWDLSTRRQIAKFSTGQGLVKALAFSPDGRLIASGGADSTVLLWPLRDLLSGAAAPADVATLWIDLNQNADIPRAYRSIERLAARPAESMPIFREKLKPRTPVPAARLTSLFADLAGEDFARREKATRDLTALGDVIVRDLVKLRKESASAEVARRVSGILDRFADRRPTEGFAVQTLEAIDNADAVRLLEELASGVPGAGLTLEAQAALARRDRRLKAIQ